VDQFVISPFVTFNSAKFFIRLAGLFVLLLAASFIASARPEISLSEDEKTLIVESAPDSEVIAFGKSVLVKKTAKGVFAFGGDVVVEGEVTGDIATIGGNVIQRDGGYIGGDVIVFGGSYRSDSSDPRREVGKETVVFGVWEDELRDLAQHPSQILTPAITWTYVAQRVLIALFWFAISLVFTTLAPGAVGRAVARIQLSSLKVAAIGSAAFIITTIAIVGSMSVLPDYLSATFGIMGLCILLLGYVFGRITLQVAFGKMVQKHMLSGAFGSETLATLIGVIIWTTLLSIPYVWILALFSVFAFGVGLILTSRSSNGWQNA
jgi:hypothetical protein